MRQVAAEDDESMKKAVLYLWGWAGPLSFIILFAWPLLALPAGVFSKGYFVFWVVITLIWGWVALLASTLLPLWESRSAWRVVLTPW